DGITYDFCVERFLPSGDPDPTFGAFGVVVTDFAAMDDIPNGVVIDSQGRIVVVGSAQINGPHGPITDFAVVRYATDGSLDASSGSGGKALTDFGFQSNVAERVAIDGQNRIVVAGEAVADPSMTNSLAVARYTPSGTLDATFGSGGMATFADPSGN